MKELHDALKELAVKMRNASEKIRTNSSPGQTGSSVIW